MTRVLAALAGVASPGLVLACAACARDTRPWAQALVAAMIGTPFLVAAVVARIVLRGDGEVRS